MCLTVSYTHLDVYKRQVCTLTMEFYRRNYIEGLFLSSGIIVSPTHTMQLLLETVRMLRLVYHFNGYIHVKGIPGADPSVIEETGWYVDRMSVNLELATACLLYTSSLAYSIALSYIDTLHLASLRDCHIIRINRLNSTCTADCR